MYIHSMKAAKQMIFQGKTNQTFCSRKFKSLLFTASVSMLMEYLMLLSDTIIIGNIFGEAAIAASNLVSPVFSVAVFFSTMISVGTSMLYSYEMGKFQKDRADHLFGQGVLLAVMTGIVLFLLAFFGKTFYFSFMNPSEIVGGYARQYYRYYQFLMLLYPMYALLIDMVYADGDELICNLSYVAQIGINIPASILLCHRIGVGGASLGTLIGTIISLMVLVLHFFRKQNSLKFVSYLSVQDIVKVAKSGVMDSIVYLFWGITACVVNKFVIARFGEYYLPVLSVIISVIELTIVFDGIGQAITPLVNVYRGEKNTEGVRKVMGVAGKAAALEGIGATLILFFFGKYLAAMLGISDPGLLELSQRAIRLASPFLVFSAVLFLLTTYYLLDEKMLLATCITALKDCVMLIFLMLVGGMLFGIDGVWGGFGIAPLFSMGICYVLVSLRFGRKSFPLLLREEKGEILDYDLYLTETDIIQLRDTLENILTERHVGKKTISRIMLLTEELEMLILEKNPGKKIISECTLIIKEDIQLIFRDNGILFDITDGDNAISSMRSYMVANMMNVQSRKNHLVTTSYNRNAFRFEKEEQAEQGKSAVLTPQQKVLFEMQEKYPESTLYNTFYFVRFDEALRLPDMERAISETIRKHQSLLTTLHREEDGNIYQCHSPEIFKKVEAEEISEEAFESCKADLAKPYKLLEAPLYRCRLFQTDSGVYLYFGAHHIVFDGISSEIIFRDILRVYRGEELAEDNYYEILRKREEEVKQPLYGEAKTFYENLAAKKTWSSMPRPDFTSGEGSMATHELSVRISEEDLRRAEKASGMSRTGLGILATALSISLYNQASDILMTWIYHGRTEHQLREATGLFYREIPAAFSFEESTMLQEMLTMLRREMKQGMKYSLYPYIAMEQNSKIVCFLYQGDMYDVNRSEEIALQEVPLEKKNVISDNAMQIYLFSIDREYRINIEYDTGFYSRESMDRFDRIFEKVFLTLLQNAEKKDMTIKELVAPINKEENHRKIQ